MATAFENQLALVILVHRQPRHYHSVRRPHLLTHPQHLRHLHGHPKPPQSIKGLHLG